MENYYYGYTFDFLFLFSLASQEEPLRVHVRASNDKLSSERHCSGPPERISRDVGINISSVVEFQRWWALKSKIFGQESTFPNGLLVTQQIWNLVSSKSK